MAARYGIFGSGTENWKSNAEKTQWRHIGSPHMRVIIRPNHNKAVKAKYEISHTHPGPRGAILPQSPEYAKTMVEARKMAKVHLKHWNNPLLWAKDPDFGKRN